MDLEGLSNRECGRHRRGKNSWVGCRKEVTAAIQMSNEGSLEVGVKKWSGLGDRSIKGSGV